MTERPFMTAICPSYARPELLANAIACFLRQDYPADRRALVILDDAHQYVEAANRGGECHWLMKGGLLKGEWCVISEPSRYPSLPAKYNSLVENATRLYPQTDAFVVWEDDDIYFPWHIASHARALRDALWSKPSRVLSTYPGYPDNEASAGRFMASIALCRELMENVEGWPLTRRADFDQLFMAELKTAADEPADTLRFSPHEIPGYCFRWSGSGSWHGQEFMRSPDDETWWDRAAQHVGRGARVPMVDRLLPRMDADTLRVCGEICSSRISEAK